MTSPSYLFCCRIASLPSGYPLSSARFGDTAANVGVLTLLEAFESTRSLPLPVKSVAGSAAAGLWRIGITPIDAYKTTLQVLYCAEFCGRTHFTVFVQLVRSNPETMSQAYIH